MGLELECHVAILVDESNKGLERIKKCSRGEDDELTYSLHFPSTPRCRRLYFHNGGLVLKS